MLIRASIPQSGYVPGQTIVISTEISNQSSIKVEEVKFGIRKIVHYHSQSPHTKTLEEIVDVCEQRVSGRDGKVLEQLKQDLVIPAVPPTIATLSRVININYEVKVEVKVRGAHINPIIRLPITIGTYPLTTYYQPHQQLNQYVPGSATMHHRPEDIDMSVIVGHSSTATVEPIMHPLMFHNNGTTDEIGIHNYYTIRCFDY